jgi:hypothetical protein
MKGKLFLIQWDADEVQKRAEFLRAKGWDVEVEFEDGARACQRILARLPEAVVISLDRLPSHGRATALGLRESVAGKRCRLVFVDGKDEAVSKARARIPEAGFTTSSELESFLKSPSPFGLFPIK